MRTDELPEVAENAMRTDELPEVAELTVRAIRMTRSMTTTFIFTSPLPRVHFCPEKLWRNPYVGKEMSASYIAYIKTANSSTVYFEHSL